jgi:hypothetical protein
MQQFLIPGARRRSGGRPARRGRAATEQVTIRLTSDELAAFKRAAGDAPLADWIRTRCAAAAELVVWSRAAAAPACRVPGAPLASARLGLADASARRPGIEAGEEDRGRLPLDELRDLVSEALDEHLNLLGEFAAP